MSINRRQFAILAALIACAPLQGAIAQYGGFDLGRTWQAIDGIDTSAEQIADARTVRARAWRRRGRHRSG